MFATAVQLQLLQTASTAAARPCRCGEACRACFSCRLSFLECCTATGSSQQQLPRMLHRNRKQSAAAYWSAAQQQEVISGVVAKHRPSRDVLHEAS